MNDIEHRRSNINFYMPARLQPDVIFGFNIQHIIFDMHIDMRNDIFLRFYFYAGGTALGQEYIKIRTQRNAFNFAELFGLRCHLAITLYPVAMKETGV